MPNPAELSARCSRCGHELWKQRAGQWTLQQRILKLDGDGRVVARCSECSTDVPIPFLTLTDPTKDAAAVPRVNARMVVRTR